MSSDGAASVTEGAVAAARGERPARHAASAGRGPHRSAHDDEVAAEHPAPAGSSGPEVSPVGGDFLLHSGMLLLGRMLTEAVGFYNRRFALDKKDVGRIYDNLARTYRQKGREEKAIAAYQELVKLNPQNAGAHYQLALLYRRRDPERAINALRIVVRLRPGAADAHFRLGVALLQARQLEEARASLERAVELQPQHARAWHRLGVLYDKLERSGEAVEALTRAVELEPEEVRYHQQLGFVLEGMGRHDEAVVCFKTVLELESELDDDEL